MEEFLNANTLFNTIAMAVGSGDCPVLVVEGELDSKLLKRHLSDVKLIKGNGKRNVVNAAALADKRGIRCALFIVDRDYDDVGKAGLNASNLIVSEGHDLSMDIAAHDSRVLWDVIDVHIPDEEGANVSVSDSSRVKDICDEAVSLAAHLAAVRIVDRRSGTCLKFNSFAFQKLNSSSPGVREVAEKIIRNSTSSVDDASFINNVKCVRSDIDDRMLSVVGDHDFFGALEFVIGKKYKPVAARQLTKGFILAVRRDSLEKVPWYIEILSWMRHHNARICVSG